MHIYKHSSFQSYYTTRITVILWLHTQLFIFMSFIMKNTWILYIFPRIIIKAISVNVHMLSLQWKWIIFGNIVWEFPTSSYTVGISYKLIFWKKNLNHSEPFIAKESILLILMGCEQGTEWVSKKPLEPDLTIRMGVMHWGKPQWEFWCYHMKFHCFFLWRYTALFFLYSAPLRKLRIQLPLKCVIKKINFK